MQRTSAIGDIQPFAELAHGPTTVVYKAYQRSLERFVLLKVLRAGVSHDDELVRRFEAEARLVAQVQHPNVVAIYAHGWADGQAYLAAEFVEGVDVRDLLAGGPLPPELAAFVVLEAARGLQAAHACDILHRDLKPSNVLVAHEGHVKLTDFGMASLAGEEAGAEVRGTPAYLAPELVRGHPPTVASDLFSLGATFYEALAARPAFTGADTGAVFDAVLHHDPMPRLERFAEVPAGLRQVVARLLDKRPDARYPHTDALLADLEAFLAAPGWTAGAAALRAYLDDPEAYRNARPARVQPAATPEPDSPPAPRARAAAPPGRSRPSRRARWAVGFAAALLLAGGVGGGFLLGDGPADLPAAGPTEEEAMRLPEVDTGRPVGTDAAPATETPPAARDDAAPQDPPPPENRARAETTAQADAETPPSILDETPREAAAEPVRAAGTLRLVVSPWADVYLDDDLLGRTPLQALDLPVGTHRLRLVHPPFPEHAEEVEIRAGETQVVNVVLWDYVGQVWLTVSPWAEVLVDGVVRDTIPPQEQPLVVRPGAHRLVLRHPQLGTLDTTFAVGRGETRRLRFNLNRLLGQ